MKCLLCKNINLEKTDIDDNLTARKCPDCGGIWIQAKAYWKWIKYHGNIHPEKSAAEPALSAGTDSVQIKICPDCGHFLTKRKVGHGIAFHIDRCQCCGGIWLDKNEWEILKSRNLHDEIHFIFSREWQEEIINEEKKAAYEREVEKIIGIEDYKYLKSFADKYRHFPRRDVILAYLQHHLAETEE